MNARMKHPALVVPEAMPALLALSKSLNNSAKDCSLPTLELIYLRASQINGCGVCVDMHARDASKAGESNERLFSVAAWRETPYFTESERAALALTEAVTRLSDRADPVPDDLYEEAARHFDDQELATLILAIATINVWNRRNASTRQIAGEWVA
jgi:AhpD family alkylhydroperoxidase